MLLQTGAKVHHAHHTVDDGNDNQNDGDDREGGHRLLDGLVESALGRVINSGQLENEVGEAAEVEDHDENHAPLPFPSSKPCCTKEDGDCDGDGRTGQAEFNVSLAADNDEELNGEADEEEEIELQKGNIDLQPLLVTFRCGPRVQGAYLVVKESLLHPVVSPYVLQNIPSELLIQLPGNETEADSTDGNNAGNSNQNALYILPNIEILNSILSFQDRDSFVHLVNLNRGINHQGEVCDTNSDDLNRILDAESVPNEDKFVKKAEYE